MIFLWLTALKKRWKTSLQGCSEHAITIKDEIEIYLAFYNKSYSPIKMYV